MSDIDKYAKTINEESGQKDKVDEGNKWKVRLENGGHTISLINV